MACNACPRLRAHCQDMAAKRRRAYRNEEYWGLPLPGFGDPHARVLIVGLAPAAHGGNRTGRVFTGDRSGDFLFGALYRAGFASQPTSVHRADGLRLRDVYITAAVKCAPPENKPALEEITSCRRFLIEEIQSLKRVNVVLALGKIAFDSYFDLLRQATPSLKKKDYPFRHGAIYRMGDRFLVGCYHPSQQNTFTKKLTSDMMDAVFGKVSQLLNANAG